MAQDRAIVDEAYAGDIIGLFDPGIFSIGDTLCTGKKKVQFAGIPTFSAGALRPHEQKDTMKRKQFVKGMEQIAQEGAIQIFREVGGGMEEVIVGVVGVLQFEVLEYRLNTEYNVEVRCQPLGYTDIRWIANEPGSVDVKALDLTRRTLRVEDMRGSKMLLPVDEPLERGLGQHRMTTPSSNFPKSATFRSSACACGGGAVVFCKRLRLRRCWGRRPVCRRCAAPGLNGKCLAPAHRASGLRAVPRRRPPAHDHGWRTGGCRLSLLSARRDGTGQASHGVHGSARARFQRVAGWFLLRVRVLSAPLPFGCRCFRLVVDR